MSVYIYSLMMDVRDQRGPFTDRVASVTNESITGALTADWYIGKDTKSNEQRNFFD